jgi:hypothetical protein
LVVVVNTGHMLWITHEYAFGSTTWDSYNRAHNACIS